VNLRAVRDPGEDLALRIRGAVDDHRLDVVRAERRGGALDPVFRGGCGVVGHGVDNP